MQPLIELTISSSSFNRMFNRKFISVVVKCSCNSVTKVKALNYTLHCTANSQSCSFLCLAVPTASKAFTHCEQLNILILFYQFNAGT